MLIIIDDRIYATTRKSSICDTPKLANVFSRAPSTRSKLRIGCPNGIRELERESGKRRWQPRELRCKSYAKSQPTSRNWSDPPAISPPYRLRELQIRVRARNGGRNSLWARRRRLLDILKDFGSDQRVGIKSRGVNIRRSLAPIFGKNICNRAIRKWRLLTVHKEILFLIKYFFIKSQPEKIWRFHFHGQIICLN